MLIPVVLFVIGLALIMLGGDRFVDASVAISRKLGIPQIVVGATIVSLGTTLPEILVSATAAFQGSADIAAGNAFGSVICNTALIAGVGQLLRPTRNADTKAFGWRMGMFLVYAVFLMITGLLAGQFTHLTGIILVLGFVLYAVLSIRTASDSREEEPAAEGESLGRSLITLVVCAAMLFVGARLLVDNGIIIAEAVGVPERVIAVTFIALGTSLPEFVTAITAVIKGYEDVSLGNIIGANLINLLLVIGIPAAITGMNLSPQVAGMDIPLGIGLMLLLVGPIFLKKRGYRIQGALLIASYAVYCIVQF